MTEPMDPEHDPREGGGREAEEAASQALRPIHIENGVVRRPAQPWTRRSTSSFGTLRDGGLECVPEPLGIDGEIESLGFIAGESGGAEAGLRSAARLLRRILLD